MKKAEQAGKDELRSEYKTFGGMMDRIGMLSVQCPSFRRKPESRV